MGWLSERFEIARGGRGGNLTSMEGLRGFAVFLVFLTHYVTLVEPWLDRRLPTHALADALHAVGNAGVDLFFVLSGYLIYGTLIAKPRDYAAFITRRAQRIYPAFLVVLALYVALSFAFPNESRIPGDALRAALYLVANVLLLPGLFPIEPVITVAWSLSYEMAYYVVIPVVIATLALRTRRPAVRVLVFLMAALVMLAACAGFGGPVRLVMFIAGILLFEAMASSRGSNPGSAAGLVALCIGLGVVWLPPALLPTSGSASIALKMALLFICFFVLCFSCFRAPASAIARAFSWLPMRWLGNMSYSYYLLHGLTLKAAFMVMPLVVAPRAQFGWQFWALLPVMFVLSLPPAVALFLLVERPFSLARKRSGSEAKRAGPVWSHR